MRTDERMSGFLMFEYAMMAVIGHIWSGHLIDMQGADYTVSMRIIILKATFFVIFLSVSPLIFMALSINLLGKSTYYTTPSIHTGVAWISHIDTIEVPVVAPGMNIIGCNGEITLGSHLCSVALEFTELTSPIWVERLIVVIGILWMLLQTKLQEKTRHLRLFLIEKTIFK
ncbi:hypothetical protein ACTVM3_14660 [Serratia nematodiphila]